MIRTDKKLIYADLTYLIRRAIFNVYNGLGYGHKEQVYQKALGEELQEMNVSFKREKSLDVSYKGSIVGNYRPDFVVDEKVILELKAVEFMPKSYETQLIHYLKTTGYMLGLLVNFGTPRLYIKRLVWTNQHPRESAFHPRKSTLRALQKGFIKFTKRSLAIYLITMLVITGSGLLYLFNPFVKKTEAAWYDDNWTYRKPVVITNSTSQESNVKATLSSYDASDTGKYQSDCGDVRFVTQGGEVLDYTVSTCGATTSFDIVFKTLYAGANIVYLYFGNPDVANGFLSSTSASACTNCSTGTAGSEEKSPGPILYFKLNEATDNTCSGGSNDACNSGSGGNDLDGAANNTPTWQTDDFCIQGKCLWFDGANNENISVSDNAMLDFAAAGNFTIQAWVKRNGASAANNFIITKAQSGYTGYKLYQDASGDYCFDVSDGTNTDSACTQAVEFDDDKWHLVTGVKTGTTSITLYVDGLQRAQDASIAATGTLANTGTFYAGVDLDGTSNEWLGFIDEVKVYNFARSDAQIKTDFALGGSGKGTGVTLGGNRDISGALSDGLVGYWKEDEADNANATDSSGNAATLTDTNTVARAAGKFSNGANFELDTSEYQYAADTAPLSITGSLTLSAWIKPETVTAGSYNILGKWDGSNESYRLFQNGDEIRIELDSAGNYVETSSSNLAASTWYHVTGVYDAATATARIYLNAELATTTTTGTIPSSIGDDAGRFHIGAEDSTTTAANFYDGIIDEARVYNRALSWAEVLSLYNFAPGPVGYFKFDENSGTSAFDASGNGNDGTLTNSPSYSSGKFGSGLNLSGSNAHVTRADDSDFDFGNLASFTLSAWIKHAPSPSTSEVIISKFATQGYKLYMETDGDITFSVDDDTNVADTLSSTAATYDDNNWHHIAAMRDSSTAIRLYIDGVLITNQTSFNSPGNLANTDPLYIGIDEDATSSDWIGQIDEVKIYSYARSYSQVIEDMNATHPAPGSPVGSPYGYWKFDEGVENTCLADTTDDICNSGYGGSTWEGPIAGNAAFTTTAKYGKALIFDGTGDRANVSTLSNLTGAAQITWTFWINPINPDSLATSRCIFCKVTDPSSPTNASWAIMTSSSDSSIIRSVVTSSTTSMSTYGESPAGTLANGRWDYVAVVYDGTQANNNDRIKIYLNGRPVSTTMTGTIPTTGPANSSANATIAAASTGLSGTEFNGVIDEVKVYLSALTAEQVKLDMNRGSAESLGALSDNSGVDPHSTGQAHCVPGDSATCTVPPGEWKFDEASGTTAFDHSGTTGNNGTISGASWTSGKVGAALDFDGTDDVVTVSNHSEIDLNNNGNFTFVVWIWADSAGEGSGGQIYNKGTNNYLRVDTLSSGSLDVEGKLDLAGANDANLNVSAAITTNTWNHIAITYTDDTDDEITIYVNGVNKGSSTGGSGAIAGEANSLLIGGPSTDNFDGKIDHFRFFGRELTPAQIAWDYNKGAPLAHWKMDECQGTTINDSAGNSLTGTLTPGGAPISSAGDCTTSATTSWYGGRNGKINSGIDLDGTDDYISVTDTANLRFDASTDDFSLFAWVKRDTTGTEYIMSKEDADNDGWRLMFSSNNVVCSEDATDVTSSSTITDTNWHFVGCTIDRDGNGQVYIDGKADGSAVSMGTDAMATTSNITLGTRSYTATSYLNGQIDDVKIFNYALTAVQVRTIYNGGGARFAPVTGTP